MLRALPIFNYQQMFKCVAPSSKFIWTQHLYQREPGLGTINFDLKFHFYGSRCAPVICHRWKCQFQSDRLLLIFRENSSQSAAKKCSCSPQICKIAPVKDSRCWYERTTEAGGSKGGSSGSHHMLGKWYLMMGWAAQTRVIVARATSHTLTISETREIWTRSCLEFDENIFTSIKKCLFYSNHYSYD